MKDAILFGPFLGELYWEFGRFVPHFIWKRKKQYKNKDVEFIVLTKPENFDMYGRYANILVPLRLKNNDTYKPNCFRMDNLKEIDYFSIINTFKNQFKNRYNILETIYPDISKNQYSNKNQFTKDKMIYEYKPRLSNYELVNKYLTNDKPVIVLAPRYREGLKRNWPYWNDFYDLIIENEDLFNKYNFIICGRSPDYVPDNRNRFLDINFMNQNMNTSLIGLTMEFMKKSILTIGSQSAIPNISLLFGVHALEWGHQKQLHTINYNIRRTKVTFIEDMKYKISPKEVYKEMIRILK
jgi:hypothetical protein